MHATDLERQKEVLRLVAIGTSLAKTARVLHLSVPTVRQIARRGKPVDYEEDDRPVYTPSPATIARMTAAIKAKHLVEKAASTARKRPPPEGSIRIIRVDRCWNGDLLF